MTSTVVSEQQCMERKQATKGVSCHSCLQQKVDSKGADADLDRQQLDLAIVIHRLSEGGHKNLLGCVGVRQQAGASCQIQAHLRQQQLLATPLVMHQTWTAASLAAVQCVLGL